MTAQRRDRRNHLLPPTWQLQWRRLRVEFGKVSSERAPGQGVVLLTDDPISAHGKMLLESAIRTTRQTVGQLSTRTQLQNLHGRVRAVTGSLVDHWNLLEAHEHAASTGNPYASPHGLFRDLQNGNVKQAIEFLQKFGPLVVPHRYRWGGSAVVTVDLADFWALQLRYSLVAGLYEAVGSVTALREAWRAVHDRAVAAAKAVVPAVDVDAAPSVLDIPLGARREDRENGPVVVVPRPWESSIDGWLTRASGTELREAALQLVHSELNLHCRGTPTWWERGWERTWAKFRPVAFLDSLWSAIWFFFGLDTADLFWRRCRACQRLFYPSRASQIYHSAREQSLFSKRQAARRRRARERRTASVS